MLIWVKRNFGQRVPVASSLPYWDSSRSRCINKARLASGMLTAAGSSCPRSKSGSPTHTTPLSSQSGNLTTLFSVSTLVHCLMLNPVFMCSVLYPVHTLVHCCTVYSVPCIWVVPCSYPSILLYPLSESYPVHTLAHPYTLYLRPTLFIPYYIAVNCICVLPCSYPRSRSLVILLPLTQIPPTQSFGPGIWFGHMSCHHHHHHRHHCHHDGRGVGSEA